MRVSANEVFEFVVSMVLAGSILLATLTAALRFGVRPLLEEWAKRRFPPASADVERRLASLEDDVRQLRTASNFQLPAELRAGSWPRT